MIPGFERIIEERILSAQKRGEFNDLTGTGEPLVYEDDSHVPEELRLAHKILRNAGYLPPEVEMRNEIERTEDLLASTEDVAEKYRILKKLNFLIMKLNTARTGSAVFDLPQRYLHKVAERIR